MGLKTFKFVIDEKLAECAIEIQIPFEGNSHDFVNQWLIEKNIPPDEVKTFVSSLTTFIKEENQKYFNDLSILDKKNFLKDENKVFTLVDYWSKYFEKEDVGRSLLTDEQIFADAYSYLIMSPYLEAMLQIEYDHIFQLSELLLQRTSETEGMKNGQQNEMNTALLNLTDQIQGTEKDISYLANKQSEDIHMLESSWDSKLSCVRSIQKKEFREWVMKVYEDDNLRTNSLVNSQKEPASTNLPTSNFSTLEDLKITNNTKFSSPLRNLIKSVSHLNVRSNNLISSTDPALDKNFKKNIRLIYQEESFTVNLGCQLKSTYNLRLLRCYLIWHFCDFNPINLTTNRFNSQPINDSEPFVPEKQVINEFIARNPNKLQTLLTLYTDKLQAIVIIEDGRLDISRPGPLKDLASICEKSTDYHFPELDQQIERVKQNYIKAASNGGSNGDRKSFKGLSTGDVYITRHSNLAHTHIVFHLCVNDLIEMKWLKSGHDTSVRNHAGIFEGLRNIIRCCFTMYDVQTLTIPLLLVDEVNEEMTLNWCGKRAELVFKCVKGYVIETQSFSSSYSYGNNNNTTNSNVTNNDNNIHGNHLTSSSHFIKNMNGSDLLTSESFRLPSSYYGRHNDAATYGKSKILQFHLPALLSKSAFEHVANLLPQVFRLPTPLMG